MRTRAWFGLAAAVTVVAVGAFVLNDRPLHSAPSEDEQSIRKLSADYAAALNKGDIDALAAFWATDAEYIDDEGKSTKGRAAIAALFKKFVTENKGTKVRIATTALRFFNDVAWQDGVVHVSEPDSEEQSSPFTAVWTRKDGKWLLSLVRDQPNTAAPADEPHTALKDLGWLVGDWSHEEKGVKTSLNVKWMKGERFLVCNMTVVDKGEETLSLIQIIGWDPTGDRLHSWVFDTRGGFGEGYWSRKGETWTAEVAGVTADGRAASGTNLWKKVDGETFTFEGLDRDVDGTSLPDVRITYKRAAKTK